MVLEKQRIRRTTVRMAHSWQAAYSLALRESDPSELDGRIEYAIGAIERRYSEWDTDPGSPAELKAIQKCISALKRLMKQEQTRRSQRNPCNSVSRNSGTTSLRLASNI